MLAYSPALVANVGMKVLSTLHSLLYKATSLLFNSLLYINNVEVLFNMFDTVMCTQNV